MTRKRSKTVDAHIKRMWAKMGAAAAENAIKLVIEGTEDDGDTTALWAEVFFERAGADACRWYGDF